MPITEAQAPVAGQLPPNGAIMSHGSDHGLVVEFYKKAIQNRTKTIEAGRPIFDEIPYVKIIVPGDRNMTVDTKVNDTHRERFPREWAKFEAGMVQTAPGTPLAQWPLLTVREVAELNAMNVTTVEQLAEVSDGVCAKFNGLLTYRKNAQVYIASAKDSAQALRQEAIIREQNEKIAMQGEELRKLQDAVARLTANAVPGAAIPIAPPGPTSDLAA